MPVFDKTTKTARNVADPGTDKNLPDGGALTYGAMTTLTALAGTTGVDCKLVTGDRWQEIAGNMTEHYTLIVTSTIDQDWNTTVNRNWTINVNGIMSLTVALGYTEVENGPVNRTYYEIVTDTFKADHYIEIKDDSSLQSAKYVNTWTSNEAIAIVGGLQMAVTLGMCVTLVLFLPDVEYKTLHAEYHLLHGDGKRVELYNVEAKCKIFGAKSEIGAAVVVKKGVDLVPFVIPL